MNYIDIIFNLNEKKNCSNWKTLIVGKYMKVFIPCCLCFSLLSHLIGLTNFNLSSGLTLFEMLSLVLDIFLLLVRSVLLTGLKFLFPWSPSILISSRKLIDCEPEELAEAELILQFESELHSSNCLRLSNSFLKINFKKITFGSKQNKWKKYQWKELDLLFNF